MESSALGGGLLLALAAALWLVYLVPNWLRRREYLATERNAVRLQQTIRVLAETAEAPEAVRVESAARAKALARELASQPVAVGAPVRSPLPVGMDPRALAARRLRRTRLIVSLLLVAALGLGIAQAVIGVVGGLAAVSVPLAVGAGIVAASGIALLGRLAKVGRERAAGAPAAVAAPSRRPVTVPEVGASEAAPRSRPTAREWTPVPVPRATYLERRAVAVDATPAEVARAAARAEAELSEAAEAASRAIRSAEERVPGAARAEPPAPAAPPSRFAQMGVVDAAAVPAMPDIERALRRRRAG